MNLTTQIIFLEFFRWCGNFAIIIYFFERGYNKFFELICNRFQKLITRLYRSKFNNI